MFVYLETTGKDGKPTGKFNNRGEVGPNDDPESFARMMEKNGLRVVLSEEDVGYKNVPAKSLGLEG